ncbi:hypothetical protein BJ546DRAFT_998996 [Cryomyces antarcticus]|nr:hypothetical protein LTR04_006477 [Oleoguttula sp. CCFEE 6159]
MATTTGIEVLEGVVQDGSMDIEAWPRVLEELLSMLSKNIHDFPIPSVLLPEAPPRVHAPRTSPTPASSPLTTRIEEPGDPGESLSQESQTTNKENAPPSGASSPRPPVPTFSDNRTAPTTAYPQAPDSTLPSQLLSTYHSIIKTLTTQFRGAPPHTIQRLAELVLRPRAHYRFLPPYLNALDRVISVSSTTEVFPLPQATLPSSTNISFLQNDDITGTSVISTGLGTDEALGGALLTPIPWLRPKQQDGELRSEKTETIDGPNGAGRVETVSVALNGHPGVAVTPIGSTSAASQSPATSETIYTPTPSQSPTTSANLHASIVSPSPELGDPSRPLGQSIAEMRAAGAVTQGELLRQEQEAGVVPVAQHSPRRLLSSMTHFSERNELPEELPHARGPGIIGMEDTGPQERMFGGGLDMEAAVGRSYQPGSKEELTNSEEEEAKMEDEAGHVARMADQEEAHPTPSSQENATTSVSKGVMSIAPQKKDSDGDIEVTDADGKTEEDTSGNNITPDAIDSTVE